MLVCENNTHVYINKYLTNRYDILEIALWTVDRACVDCYSLNQADSRLELSMLPKEEYLYTVQCITVWTFLHCVCLKHYVPCIIQAKQFGPVQRWTLDKTRYNVYMILIFYCNKMKMYYLLVICEKTIITPFRAWFIL